MTTATRTAAPAPTSAADLPRVLRITISGKYLDAFDLREYATNPDADEAYQDLALVLADVPRRATPSGYYVVADLTHSEAGTLLDLAQLEHHLCTQPGTDDPREREDARSTARAAALLVKRIGEQGIVSPAAEAHYEARNLLTPWRLFLDHRGARIGCFYAPGDHGMDQVFHQYPDAVECSPLRYKELTPEQRSHHHRAGNPPA